ncbi:MAG: DUF3094 family protein [Pseudomonadota bacterium]
MSAEDPQNEPPAGSDSEDQSFQNQLNPEDQKKVDEFVNSGINSVERKPFKPMRMMLLLIVVVTVLSVFSQLLASWFGAY